MSSEDITCPICLDNIDLTRNIVTTECGHTFHCSCLMRNVLQNGFNCPYCRQIMTEENQINTNPEESMEQQRMQQQRMHRYTTDYREEYNVIINTVIYIESDNFQDILAHPTHVRFGEAVVVGEIMYFPVSQNSEEILYQPNPIWRLPSPLHETQ